MFTFFILAVLVFSFWLVVGAIYEGIFLARQPDMEAYIRRHYTPHPANGGLRIYGPSPIALFIANRMRNG
jgi:hypothetical protein